ncbi:hypothetical protein [Parafrankia sp. EUN1f]|uniref:hypothetical protein n=1 Tax=Parafrankia sp. EUN1f TaxID=102897 RepID=UPI0001C45241|nr:hypothetical protein [Parafrankia sp. EUN1f]EFC79190.1 hypothetical protein FrEUN1fDRAFT_7697 [Parafrankia sp. EUN1f]EFC80321.1 hypothetical protein FrEUN1fDRAFT_6548 [Parafrankia sp. EUN1f]
MTRQQRTPMVRGGIALVLTASVLTGLTACGSKNDADKFAEKLRTKGYGKVHVSADIERKGGKKRTVAYDAHVLVNTDADPQTCDVELENDVRSSGRGLVDYFDVDEVRDARGSGHEVEDDRTWPDNPTLTQLRAELVEHSIDC